MGEIIMAEFVGYREAPPYAGLAGIYHYYREYLVPYEYAGHVIERPGAKEQSFRPANIVQRYRWNAQPKTFHHLLGPPLHGVGDVYARRHRISIPDPPGRLYLLPSAEPSSESPVSKSRWALKTHPQAPPITSALYQ